MAGDLDAYLTFEDGWYGKGQSKRIDVYGETKDVFENEYGSIQIKRYDLGFKHDTKTSEETTDPSVSDSIVADPQFEPVKITKGVDISTPYLLLQNFVRPADLEIGDTAGLETCATGSVRCSIFKFILPGQ